MSWKLFRNQPHAVPPYSSSYLDHGLEGRDWQPGGIVSLENQVEGYRVDVAVSPERVATHGKAR